MKNKWIKLYASADADSALTRMIAESNDGFTGGRITKPQLLSWIIIHFEKANFTSSKDSIRDRYFDEAAYLANLLKEMKRARHAGEPTPDLTAILETLPKRSSSAPLPSSSTSPTQGVKMHSRGDS